MSDEARDAARYRFLRDQRVFSEGRDGGWVGHYGVYPIPAWDDTPYSKTRGEGYHHNNFDEAVDALMEKK